MIDDFDPSAELARIDEATDRVIATTRRLGDGVDAPSLCAGWTRGHVLAHIARNADGLANLLHWAATGEQTPQYPSVGQRNADIDDGAHRSTEEHLADLEASAARFREKALAVPANRWSATVRGMAGNEMSGADVLWGRLREVEIHHLDLAAGYCPADFPEEFVRRLLPFAAGKVSAHPDAPAAALRSTDLAVAAQLGDAEPRVTVSGPAAELAVWLVHRSSGESLTCEPAGQLPVIPSWG